MSMGRAKPGHLDPQEEGNRSRDHSCRGENRSGTEGLTQVRTDDGKKLSKVTDKGHRHSSSKRETPQEEDWRKNSCSCSTKLSRHKRKKPMNEKDEKRAFQKAKRHRRRLTNFRRTSPTS